MKFNLVAVLVLASLFKVQAQSASGLITLMIEHCAQLKGLTAEITKEERIDGEIVKQITAVKLIRDPFKVYLNQRYPKEGVEILCLSKQSKALINPNYFPWFNLTLDPYGSLMRRNQHHTVYDSGFDLLAGILSKELERIGRDTASHIFYRGVENRNNRPSHLVEMINPNYEIASYIVRSGEDLLSIAQRLNLNAHTILELNDDVDFYDDVSTGQKIMIPTSYARKMKLYIDVEYLLPLVISVYDDDGLYEQYSYKKFVLNPEFKAGEFTSDYEEYGF